MSLAIEHAPGAPSNLVSLCERRQRKGSVQERRPRLDIGLVNNMPDAALVGTERQFAGLLEAASDGLDLRLHLIMLSAVERSGAAKAAMVGRYSAEDALAARRYDALIVTGAEPRTARLEQEPYWDGLRWLFDWANRNGASTILSCLAAHAGALHFDGIARQPLRTKLSGIFAFELAEPHALSHGLPNGYCAPHSRRNALPKAALERAGYVTLATSAHAGVDSFVASKDALFLFLQGHPEYDADSLAREYRRDMNRFRLGEISTPPAAPENYFAEDDEAALRRFTASALKAGPAPHPLPPALGLAPHFAHWRPAAKTLYQNWLALLTQAQVESPARKLVRRYGG